jgi:hypothetical protein
MVQVTCEFVDTSDLVCCWPIDTDACCPPGNTSGEDVELAERMAEVASTMLARLSGYTVGQCSTTVRPLDVCPVCRSWCCGGADGIPLAGPDGRVVWDVEAVHIGEDTLDPSEYRWDRDHGTLWRVPPDTWPTRDARWAECGEPGAFCVDVIIGAPPDAWALQVANTLTCELMLSCTGGKCRLPRNATQVTGQGVTVQLRPDDINLLLPEVSAWVAAVNPHGARLPARVYSPEARAATGADSSLLGWARGWTVGGCCG